MSEVELWWGVCGELEVFPDWPYGSASDVLEIHLRKVWVGRQH